MGVAFYFIGTLLKDSAVMVVLLSGVHLVICFAILVLLRKTNALLLFSKVKTRLRFKPA